MSSKEHPTAKTATPFVEGSFTSYIYAPNKGSFSITVDKYDNNYYAGADTVDILIYDATGDLLRHEVQWQTGDMAGLKGKEMRLRFSLRNASLYSYWMEWERCGGAADGAVDPGREGNEHDQAHDTNGNEMIFHSEVVLRGADQIFL